MGSSPIPIHSANFCQGISGGTDCGNVSAVSSRSISFSPRDHRDPYLRIENHGGPIAVKTTVVHYLHMSREDPQFKLRMPPQLRAQAEQAARASGRSLNAELVARLESTFLREPENRSLISAARAKELALMARNGIPDEVRRRALESIAQAVSLGRDSASVDISDLHLDVGIPDAELDKIFDSLFEELRCAGYTVKLGDITSIWIEF